MPGVEINVRDFTTLIKTVDKVLSNFKTKLIGTEGARLLREMRVEGKPRRRKGAAGGPPAESECLEWKTLVILQTLIKTVDKHLHSEHRSIRTVFYQSELAGSRITNLNFLNFSSLMIIMIENR
ncbi:hypothetical protein C6W19_16680 [Bacillus sp. RJGP41]|nr:hypothetical protein C6W19_16680 [Bacillus sp. RJGP41]